MTYTALETATETGAPTILLKFTRGAVVTRLTTNAVDVTVLSATWTATQVKPSKFSLTNDVIKDALELEFPNTNTFAAQFLTDGHDDETSVIIYRTHLTDGDAEAPIVWQGVVTSGFLTEKKITLTCESLTRRLSRANLMATYQHNCRHAVYSAGCGLVRGDFDYTGTVDSIDGLVVTLTAGHGIADGALTGGEIERGGYRRFIVKHSGDDLTLIRPLYGLVATNSVTLYEGCDRTMATCITKANVENYGGFPWIDKNPFETGI